MQFYNRKQAIDRMNRLGRERTPFVFIVDYRQNRSYIETTDRISPSLLLYDLNGYTNCRTPDRPLDAEIQWTPRPEPFARYRVSFGEVMKNIRQGNSFLTNLTCRTPVDTGLTLRDIFFYSRARYKLWLKDDFTVFSPEIFVQIRDGFIRSFPMKGTIDADLPDARRQLMEDPKEMAEHATIVDLIRNDLSMVADGVEVIRYRYIDEVQTHAGPILQTSSEIGGKLPDDYLSGLGDILFRLLPAGSVTGAPKCETLRIIAQAEDYDRGFYTGVAGCFDGTNLDSAVMIRFVEQDGGRLYFKSGGGITCRSDAEKEYEEMKRKIYVPIY